MRTNQVSLAGSRMPGSTGTEFCELAHSKRAIVISSASQGQVGISVGCYTLSLTTEEAMAIVAEIQRVAQRKGI